MKRQIVSWGLVLSLFISLLPVSAMATEDTLSEDSQPAAGTTQCTCGAQPDEAGAVIHAETCPLFSPPQASGEKPAAEPDDPVTEPEDPATEPDDPVTEPEDPVEGTEKPVEGTEESVEGAEEPAQGTEEPVAEPLTPPALTCEPLDEFSSSDMVLTVEGTWDSYAWEACAYGFWSDWVGDGPSLTLSKEDFTAYGFRCTVTLGEQSVTNEAFAYDPAVLERPAMSLMANGLAEGSLEDESEYIQYCRSSLYSTRFDIQGMDHGTAFKTTYINGGYRTAISVNEGAKVEVPYQSNAVSVGSSLTAQTKLEIVNGDRYVKITYTVTNNGSTTQEFQIGSSADVMIDNNDRAKVTGTSTGLSMDGAPKNNYTFQLVAPDCKTLWYGFYSQAYNNIFTDLSDKSNPYSGDSGMAWSWEGTVAPGQTWTRYVLIGAGELPDAPNAPVLDIQTTPIWKAGEAVTITGTADGSPAASTVYVNFGGTEYKATVQNGQFSVNVQVPEDTPEGSSSFTYWGTTDEGGISEIKTQTVTIVAAPFVTLTTDSVTVMEGDTLDEAALKRYIRSSNGTVTISLSSIDTNTPGTVTVTYTASKVGFENKTATLTVTVLPKPAALSGTTATLSGDNYTFTATMESTGGLEYEETGFVYGALQNPTLTLNDGKVTTVPPVNSKNGPLSATISKDSLVYGVSYYARAYAKVDENTVIYGDQTPFGVGNPRYGTFSVLQNTSTSGNKTTFTITRTGGTDGEQTVYYRTVNGSAIGGTHFEHQADSVTFEAGQESATVTVTEYGVTSTYGTNAATAYSNANRTYSFEIYRVVGGATINSTQKSATRTMTKDSGYTVGRTVYNEKERLVSTSNDNNFVADRSGSNSTDQDVYFTNSRKNNQSYPYVVGDETYYYNFNVQRSVDVGTDLENAYLKATATGFLYKATFDYYEDDDCYQHVWVANHEPDDLNGFFNVSGPLPLTTGVFGTAIYTARWETKEKNGESGGLSLPSETCTGKAHTVNSNKENSKIVNNAYFLFDINDTAHLWFSATGQDTDRWHVTKYTDWLKVQDTKEPQLLGVAPMAGGSYLPGDSVTVALVFDEIVDSANSTLAGLGSASTITTTWGTFTYASGADTNVLYFTGTVPENASGTITLTSLDCAGQIKDMCDTEGTVSVGSGSTDVTLGTGANAPQVSVSPITITNGTLTGTVSTTNTTDVKLEYVWSSSATAPDTGWTMITSGTAVHTKQTSGTWYLHARATNSSGAVNYAKSSFTGSDPVQPPSLTVTVNNNDWARERVITVERSPSTATVKVTLPNGSKVEEDVDSIYTATANGTYIFTLTSGDETVTKTVTVSKIDRDAPAATIADLTNTTSHTEAVTLTVNVSDGASGIKTVTGTWSNRDGTTIGSEPLTGTNGVYTATSPSASGIWTLTITATDDAGNTASDTSAAYTVNLDGPTVSVTKQSGTGSGVTYDYTITAGDSNIVAVQLPEGFTLPENVNLPTSDTITGALMLTAPGTYHIVVTDEAGHVVQSDPMTVEAAEAVDATPPEVRLSAGTNGAAPLTINVSVFEEGGMPSVTVSGGGSSITVSPTSDDGVYTGSFQVNAAGTYTVTATDGSNNEGTASITVYSVTFEDDDISIPAQLVASGDKATEPADPERVGYTFDDWYNGDAAYNFGLAVTENLTLTAQWSAIPATEPTVTKSSDLTQPYGTADGTISVTATLADDATYTLRYQWYGNTTNSTSGGTEISGATGGSYPIPKDTAVGTHYYYCVVTAKRDDNGQEAAVTSGVITVTIEKASQEPPDTDVGYKINYIAETITIDPGYEVFDAKDNGTEIEDGGPITPGTAVYICRQGSETHEPSDWTKIQIPDRPTAPNDITKTDETIKGKADGTVSGITEEMEYHTGDGQWKSGTDDLLTDLAAETVVTVRYPASETEFASDEAKVTISGSDATLKVTFLENGGTDVADKTELSYGEKITAPTISRTGYTLVGWYNGDELWNFEADPVTTNLTLEARWNLDTYTITYNLDGGTLAEGEKNPADYTVETESFSLNKPTKPGYTFAGWTEGDETTPQTTVTISKGTTDDKTYTAHWTLDAPTVTLSANKTEVTYGESITLTAAPSHGATGVTYTYQWYKGDSSTPIEGESEATLTLTGVAHSGTYTVTVTASAGGQIQTISSNGVTVTIRPKPIFATWSGLNRVYGEAGDVTVLLPDVLTGDRVTAEISGAGGNAGSYQVTATLTDGDAHNYTLQNPAATLTVQPKPVIFTVAGNAVQADGSEKKATVTADDEECPYTVSYRQDGSEVDSPTDAGEYEIWVEIINANYRHTNGSDTMQVGTLTITQAPPVVYTASFAGGEGAIGDEPVQQSAVAGGQITLPANPFSKTDSTTRYRFTGWKAEGDSNLYQPGNSYAMPARNVTFTAQWEAVFKVSGGVTEKNPDDDNAPGKPVESAVVSLWLGANKIGETETESNGTYYFDNLIPGIYNLVVTKDVRTVTSMVTITDGDRVQDASLPAYATNSVVEVAPGSPDIVVGNLDTAFTETDQKTAQDGGKVELAFTAEEKQPDEVTDDLTKIDEKAPSSVNLALTMDYAITKTVTTVSEGTETTTKETIPQAHALLEILLPLPTQLQGKYSYSVYRVHSSTGDAKDKEAQELREGESNKNKLGEYFTVNGDKTELMLYVKCFSTYAIGYSDAPETPTQPDSNSGGSGGSYTPTYPPKVEQPEHGSVTTSPKNPGKGDKVTITPTPEDGYTVDEVTVTGPDGQPVEVVANDDGTYTFVQPAGKVTIAVTFRQITDVSDCPRDETCPMAVFTDTNMDAWYHGGVHYCLENGLMNGITTTTFGPNVSTSRAMLATILYRMEGSLDVAFSSFSDVKSGAYYADAVAWASANGIVTGYSDSTFLPDKAITREEMAAMLWRYAGSPEADGSLDSFVDGAQTGSWAQPAMIWAVEQGLITGTGNDRLNPQGPATRAEVATILMRLAQTMAR